MEAEDLKNSILQLAVEGKLVPQDPNDESAAVFLNNIKKEKEQLIKAKKIKRNNKESFIYKEDGHYYEKIGKNGESVCIDDKLPFDIPDNWVWCTLGNILSVKGGKRVPKGYKLLDEPTPYIYIRVTNMKNGTIEKSNIKYIDNEVHDQIKNYTISKDDLYITVAGTIGKVGLVPEYFDGMNLTENANKLTDISIDKYFLKYVLMSDFVQSQLIDKTTQVAQPKLAIKRILLVKIPLPPLNEQKRIVSKIEEILPLIDEYGVNKEKLDKINLELPAKLKSSILQEAFQGKLVPQDPNEGPALVLLDNIKKEKEKLIKAKTIKKNNKESIIYRENGHYYEKIGKNEPICIDDELPFDIPDTWEWARIDAVCQLNPRNNIDDDMDISFVPMEKISDAYQNSYDYEIRKWGKVKKGYTHFAKNDVAVAKITPCFENRKSVIFDRLENDYGAGTTELHILRPFAEIFDLKYLLYYCKSDYFIKNGVNNFTGTAGQKRIGKKYLEKFLIPIPPLNEQKRIVYKIEQLFDSVDVLIDE